MKKIIIPWDLGATKCAAAIVEYDPKTDQFTCVRRYKTKVTDHDSLDALIDHLETNLEIPFKDADAICVGGAGVYDGQCLHLKTDIGYPFLMDFARAQKTHRWSKLAVIHDYVPILCATFSSYMENPDNILVLHQGEPNPCGRRIVLGVGTGLGLKGGVLFSDGNFWVGNNEIGHIGLQCAPFADQIRQERHKELVAFMRSEKVLGTKEGLTFEKILSSQGMLRLHQFVTGQMYDLEPEQMEKAMRTGWAKETMQLFAWYLGLFVGTVQLIFMPDGGIWVTGGVIQKHLDLFDCDDFQKGINASPAYIEERKKFSLGVLCSSDHAFLGGAYYVARRML